MKLNITMTEMAEAIIYEAASEKLNNGTAEVWALRYAAENLKRFYYRAWFENQYLLMREGTRSAKEIARDILAYLRERSLYSPVAGRIASIIKQNI